MRIRIRVRVRDKVTAVLAEVCALLLINTAKKNLKPKEEIVPRWNSVVRRTSSKQTIDRPE